MTSAPAIGFEYTPSRWLPRLCVGVAALAMLAVLCSALMLWIKLVLLVLVVLGTWRSFKASAVSIVAAVGLGANNDWTLRLASGDDVPATLTSLRMLGPLVLLRLHAPASGTQLVLLAPDNSDDDTRRRLRMRLAGLAAAADTARG